MKRYEIEEDCCECEVDEELEETIDAIDNALDMVCSLIDENGEICESCLTDVLINLYVAGMENGIRDFKKSLATDLIESI